MQKKIYITGIVLLFAIYVQAQCGKILMLNNLPWGQTTDQSAMNSVFGAGNWSQATYSNTASSIFSPSNCFVMMEGSETGNPIALNNYLASNITLIQNWVNNGGRLFINAAPNEGGNISCGFSGTVIIYNSGPFSANAVAVDPSNQVFQGPFTPVGTSFSGGYFAHAAITGSGLTNLMTGFSPSPAGTVVLAYKKWGSGVVFFGTVTQPPFWSPQPQAYNLWYNIYSYVNSIQTVSISCSVSLTGFCPAQSTPVQVNYTTGGAFTAGNVFTAQLSDASGSFSAPANIGSVTAVSNGVISAVIPSGVPAGNGYRIRVTGSYPFAAGTDNGTNIQATTAISGTASGTAVTCFGSNNGTASISLSAGTSGTYTLDGNGPFAYNSNPFNITGLAAGNHTVIASPLTGCPSSLIGVSIGSVAQLTGSGTTTATTCGNLSNGTATITLSASTSGTYTLDGNAPLIYNTNPFTITALSPGNHTIVATSAAGCVSSNILVNVGGSAVFSPTAAHTNLSQCSNIQNGTITITPTGGQGPFIYSWTGETGSNHTPFSAGNVSSLSGLNYGYYNVTVTDQGGCGVTTISNIHIEIGYLVYITNSGASSSSCGNTGSIVLYGNSGQTPYTYSLDNITYQPGNTFTGLAAGTYTAYVKDANGCVSNKSITVAAMAPIVVNPNAVASGSCANDGSIQIFRTGGAPPYTYSLASATGPWVSGNLFTGLAAGPYTAYVKDASGCVGQQSASVAAGAALSIAVSKVNTSTCTNDGSIQVNASGGTAPYTYSKDNGIAFQAGNSFTGLSQGNYPIIVKDSKGCTGSLNTTINLNTIVVTASVVNATACLSNNGKITLFRTGGYSPYSYSVDGNNYQSSTQFTNIPAGTYSGYVKDSKACIGVLNDIQVGPTGCSPTFTGGNNSAMEKVNPQVMATEAKTVNAFPNPSLTEFTVELRGYNMTEIISITVTDIVGRKIYQQKGIGKLQYRLGDSFAPGIYNVQVVQGIEKKTIKLVKE